MKNIRPIRSEEDLTWALAEIERYFEREPKPGTPEADRFDVLSTLIEAYENQHWAIDAGDPVETVKAVMEARGLSQAELATLWNSRSRASEFLCRKRMITKDQAWALHTAWGIPAELLIAPYPAGADDQKRAPRRGVVSGKKIVSKETARAKRA